MKEYMLGMLLLGMVFAQGAVEVISPSNGFSYNIKEFTDGINLFVTDIIGSSSDKVALRLKISEERYQALIKEQKLENKDAVQYLQSQAYDLEIEAKEKASEVKTQQDSEKTLSAVEKHQAVLMEVFKNAPEQAKTGLQNALERSSRIKAAVIFSGYRNLDIVQAETSGNFVGTKDGQTYEYNPDTKEATVKTLTGQIYTVTIRPEEYPEIADEIKELAPSVQILQSEGIPSGSIGSQEAFVEAHEVYMETKSTELAKEAFVEAGGEIPNTFTTTTNVQTSTIITK